MSEFQSKFFRVSDSTGFDYNSAEVKKLLDRILVEQAQFIRVDSAGFKKTDVFFNKETSSAADGKIFLWLKPPATADVLLEEIELLHRHELTHILIQMRCGTEFLPVIFWEGIPIHFADNFVRTRLSGNSYHDYCRVFLDKKCLIPMELIQLGHNYYGMRQDFRIDIQAGSFAGFMIEKHGIDKIVDFLRDFQPPVPEKPVLSINPLCRKFFGMDFKGLESEWNNYLLALPERAQLRDKFAGKNFPSEIPLAHKHCRFCYHPFEEGEICPACKADNRIELIVES
ncbi:MAG: hypothetical protein PHW04_14175 [Candidatus Wallbacteria bacterium]|nr:hypothetical protein [Candidatus Wallbacteria bacterium]